MFFLLPFISSEWLQQIAVLEEQKNESIEDAECEAKPIETETDVGQPTSKADGSDEKPNINDATMEENQVHQRLPLSKY